jgi:hypothetical protein
MVLLSPEGRPVMGGNLRADDQGRGTKRFIMPDKFGAGLGLIAVTCGANIDSREITIR